MTAWCPTHFPQELGPTPSRLGLGRTPPSSRTILALATLLPLTKSQAVPSQLGSKSSSPGPATPRLKTLSTLFYVVLVLLPKTCLTFSTLGLLWPTPKTQHRSPKPCPCQGGTEHRVPFQLSNANAERSQTRRSCSHARVKSRYPRQTGVY